MYYDGVSLNSENEKCFREKKDVENIVMFSNVECNINNNRAAYEMM